MHSFVNMLKNRIFEIGTILCFLLPPVGMFTFVNS